MHIKVKTICFDKTGTLTKGELRYSKIYNYSNIEENRNIKKQQQVQKTNLNIQQQEQLLKSTKEKNIELEEIKEFKAIPGFGIEGITQNGDKYLIGNKN